MVQWYPGHVAKAEKKLKEQVKLADAVVEVRDARIPLATGHPDIDDWVGEARGRALVLNRSDQVPKKELREWVRWFKEAAGVEAIPCNSKQGSNIQRVEKAAADSQKRSAERRKRKGLRPRPPRCAVVGFPNVGKSALVNRLLGRRACDSAPRAGLTRHLRWVRAPAGKIEVLDSPGVLPPRLDDQKSAALLAACNDVGEASYLSSQIGGVLLELLPQDVVAERYPPLRGMEAGGGEEMIAELADARFNGDIEQAGSRVLGDFQKGRLGLHALESPPPSSL